MTQPWQQKALLLQWSFVGLTYTGQVQVTDVGALWPYLEPSRQAPRRPMMWRWFRLCVFYRG